MVRMPRQKERDSRDYDTTQLRDGHARILHRDYSAHFFRWSFARRFLNVNMDVLEVGCGQDAPLARILTGNAAPYVKTYHGVDLNAVKPSGNQRITLRGNFNFVDNYEELLRERPEGWDAAVNLEVIEHMAVEHGKRLLEGLHRCLKPGGVLLLSTPCYDGKRHAANHIHEYTIPELREALENAGFQIENRFGTFMDIKHIGREEPKGGVSKEAVTAVYKALSNYFDNDALSNFFGPLYPDHARNNLWVCRKIAQDERQASFDFI